MGVGIDFLCILGLLVVGLGWAPAGCCRVDQSLVNFCNTLNNSLYCAFWRYLARFPGVFTL